MLEILPNAKEALNLSSTITLNSSDAVSTIFSAAYSSLFEMLKPFLAVLGGLLGLYIIYKIISAVVSYFQNRRVKRIDSNIQEINKKVDEILAILKPKEDKAKPKKK